MVHGHGTAVMTYQAKDYWEERLSDKFDLTRTGTLGFNPEYNRWLYKAKLRALNKAIRGHHIEIQNQKIMDVGCGTGFFIDYYAQLHARDIIGIDITNVSVSRLSQKYPDRTFMQSRIESQEILGWGKGEFDIISVFDVLYHIKEPGSFEQAMSNIAALSKTGGYIFITDLLGDGDVNQADHVTFRGLKTYQEVARRLRIEIVAIIPMYFLLNRSFWFLGLSMLNKFARVLAPLLYLLDGLALSGKRSNLKLLVARKQL
jgi:2-polyprenyl-3-methyl-5-hydroxy-6-metoxy-1,4-benzoquinol methylase